MKRTKRALARKPKKQISSTLRALRHFLRDTGGDAVVEATILFPIILMIFTGLVLLSIYLPTRASLQRATQQAVTALATEKSDAWLSFNENTLKFGTKDRQQNVYAALKNGLLTNSDRNRAKQIVENVEKRGFYRTSGTLTVDCRAVNYLIYKEITVTATRNIPVPVDLSYVRFPRTIEITASSTAVISDADGFIRDVDMINDVVRLMGFSVDFLFSAVNTLFG